MLCNVKVWKQDIHGNASEKPFFQLNTLTGDTTDLTAAVTLTARAANSPNVSAIVQF